MRSDIKLADFARVAGCIYGHALEPKALVC